MAVEIYTKMYTESIKVAADALAARLAYVNIGDHNWRAVRDIDDAIWSLVESLEDES